MGIPKNCSSCDSRNLCNAAMYSKGCHYFPPENKVEKKTHPLKKFFGKFFK